jgi:hypothetical protein
VHGLGGPAQERRELESARMRMGPVTGYLEEDRWYWHTRWYALSWEALDMINAGLRPLLGGTS